jgi:hypothetical protein
MRKPVGDRSSIRFSIGFYQALAGGKSVETAFAAVADRGLARELLVDSTDMRQLIGRPTVTLHEAIRTVLAAAS